MNQYRVTFGQQYRRDPHPSLPTIAHPDGWLTVVAPDENTARSYIIDLIGREWSMMYDRSGWGPDWDSFYPRGELLRVVVPYDGAAALLTGDVPGGDRVLVTVWQDGTGEWATRGPEDRTWAAPLPLTAAP